MAKKRGELSSNKIDQLNQLGFIWDSEEHQWNIGLETLKEYVAQHNSALVPARYKTPSGYKLGNWIQNNISRKAHLTNDRINKLDKLGIIWGDIKKKL